MNNLTNDIRCDFCGSIYFSSHRLFYVISTGEKITVCMCGSKECRALAEEKIKNLGPISGIEPKK
jgi:hypothetical protein